jgi:hypothetical protein
LVRLFKILQKASQIAKSFSPTRAGMQWIYRKTRLREWALAGLSVDRGQPSFEFESIFGPRASEMIVDDVDWLQQLLQLEVPTSWHDAVAAPLRGAA